MQLGQPEKALEYLRKATKVDPRDPQVIFLSCKTYFQQFYYLRCCKPWGWPEKRKGNDGRRNGFSEENEKIVLIYQPLFLFSKGRGSNSYFYQFGILVMYCNCFAYKVIELVVQSHNSLL